MNPAVVHDEPGLAKFPTGVSPHFSNRAALAASAIILISTIALYLPTVHHPFANLDDMGYVYENPHVQDGLTWGTIKWAARTFERNNWHPLTWLSHALDSQLFGIDPAGHHATNIAFHAINAVVLFWVMLLATGFVGRSFVVAMLFAVHPINVESVAWIAERKTLLSTLFFLLALGAYTWYARRPSDARYLTVALLFAAGLMAKPQVITLPFVLLLWDYWPLERLAFRPSPIAFRRKSCPSSPGEEGIANREEQPSSEQRFLWLVIEKAPLFALCAASAWITLRVQRVGRPDAWHFSLPVRIANALVAYVRYLGKALWPSRLAVLYLHPGNSLPVWQVVSAAAVLIAITALVVIGRRYRYLPVGWFWFLGTLLPTIGLVQVGRQAMADRYAYESFVGLFILVCWGVSEWVERRRVPRAVLPAATVAALAVLGLVTHWQIGYWEDNATLWAHTVQVTDNNWVAEDILGHLLSVRGQPDEAMRHYRNAVSINPNDELSNLMIARYERDHGLPSEAIARYKMLLGRLDDPEVEADIYENLAVLYREVGDSSAADDSLQRATRLRQSPAPRTSIAR